MVMLAVTVSCCALVARVGSHMVCGARTQATADSIALALVTRGRSVASRVAGLSAARIVSVTDDGQVVQVKAETSCAERSATAQRAVTGIG